jgi:cob(I)alamin adenosyltransferase
MEEEEVARNVLIYLNRLSDLLFVMARAENQRSGYSETFVEFGKK